MGYVFVGSLYIEVVTEARGVGDCRVGTYKKRKGEGLGPSRKGSDI